MNQWTSDDTRAAVALHAVIVLEHHRVGEGVTSKDVADVLYVTRQTARKYLELARARGTLRLLERPVMGAAVEHVYYSIYSNTFDELTRRGGQDLPDTAHETVLLIGGGA